MNNRYGVVLRGCSGRETVYVPSASDARRIRRVVNLYKQQGHFTGARTVTALANVALRRKGEKAQAIVDKFVADGIEMRENARRLEMES